MGKTVYGIFILLHGLSHLLYFGQSRRYFKLNPDLDWPDSSWVFSKLLSHEATRNLASIAMLLATIGFVAVSIGIFKQQVWWQPVMIVSAIFSSILFIVFWDDNFLMRSEKGGDGTLINLALLIALLIFKWPKFDF